ncbi:MAG: ABC transporter permease [Anaerolineae bacterium]|nr:ABC transporter permease [Anaerolineae bacterium]
MIKILDIAWKDLRRMLTNAFFLVFGLLLPLLTAGLFYFAFGGLGSGDEGGFELPTTRVIAANLDQGQAGFSAGELVVSLLEEALPGVLEVRRAEDAAAARAAVDRQEAAVAVIVPAGFSAAVYEPQGRASVEIYQDPTLMLGPGIVEAIVRQLVDSFAGAKIAATTAAGQLARAGMAPDAATLQQVAAGYAAWAQEAGTLRQGGGSPLLDVTHVGEGEQEEGGGEMTAIMGLITAGMMVFYVFFSGGAAAQSILQEEEAGTLPRLFTTPTPTWYILAAKFLASFALLAVQVVVLVILSALVFGIDWGEPLPVALAVAGLVVIAAGFGTLVNSFLRDTKQGGLVFGGLYTVLGMVGMVSVFTAGVQGANPIGKAALFVPQGWGIRAWEILLDGGGLADVIGTVAVMLLLGLAFFATGAVRFHRRYA